MFLQTPVFEGYESFIGSLQAVFGSIWNGLSTICVPGTDWTISSFFIAIFTAGIIGKLLKHFFSTFGSHFEDGLKGGRPRGDRPRTSGKGD